MLSKHFKRREFACKCGCGLDNVSTELVRVLEDARSYFNSPIIINSGLRCKDHNRRVGGASRSKHLEGIAADIRVVGVAPYRVYNYFNMKYPYRYGVGKYNTFTHIDVRPERARF